MKPDVSAVMETAIDDVMCLDSDAHRCGWIMVGPTERAAEQACIAYAIQVVEGMRCTTGFGTPCIDALRLSTAGYCDRCTTLAQLRAEKEKP